MMRYDTLPGRPRTLGDLLFACVLAIVVLTTRGQALGSDEPADAPSPAAEAGPAAEASPSTAEPAATTPSSPNEESSSAEESSSNKPGATAEGVPATDKAAATKQPAAAEKTEVLGEPLAPGMIELLQREIMAALKGRGVVDRFARFQSYAGMKLSSSAGRYTGSELTGNCRLRWYDHLLRSPLSAPAEAEKFTRELFTAVRDNHEGLAAALAMIRERLDLPKREPPKFAPVDSPRQALDVVEQSLSGAQVAYAAALAPLSKGEVRELSSSSYPVLVGQNRVGHTLNDRGTGRRLCDLMEKMDRAAMLSAAEALVAITNPQLLEQLKSLPADGDVKVEGVTGRAVARIDTPSGAIVVGGKGPNGYQLDRMRDVAAVIDLGGDDIYYDGTVGTDRPVLLVIDLEGDDVYRGSKPGIQGGAILGVSMLLDLDGNDRYQAQDVAQGSSLAGMGILVDYAGNDRYLGVRRLQGQALGGVGILLDRAGQDDYHAALWDQGFGGPLGFGLLADLEGNDHYYTGGLYVNSYKPETPGYEGWGQGVGAGIRQSASGGIGVILDGAGDDVYEFDYLSHGGGYWCGLGFARDFGGNDKRLICRKAYDGSPRTERSFQRFGCGWGCHYSLGFCFDDRGDDLYEGTIMGSGMGWDCSVGVLCDLGGNDRYEATGGLTQGTGAQASVGILFDYDGDDVHLGYGQGAAPSGISYHDLPACGGNFGFLVDYGGKDTYGCGAKNNGIIQRGSEGGFLIDRPRRNEQDDTARKSPAVTTGS